METKFDSILRHGMPFLLFSPNKFKLEISNKLAALYNLYNSNDGIEFNELYMQITDTLDNHSPFDSAKERNIESFSIRNKSYDERLREHDETVRLLKKKLGQIHTNRQYITEIKKEIKEIKKFEKKVMEKSNKKSKEKKEESTTSPSKKGGINPSCPDCGIVLEKSGKTSVGQQRYSCSKRKNGCGKCWYDIEDGKLIYGKPR